MCLNSERINEQTTKHCTYIYNLHFSGNCRGFCAPSPGKTGPGPSGVMAHENVGADSWETHSKQCSALHQPQTGSVKKSWTNVKGGGEGIKRHKGAHQDKDALGAPGLRGSGGETVVVDVSDLLLVPVQNEGYGNARPDHKPQTENIMEQSQYQIHYIQWLCDSFMKDRGTVAIVSPLCDIFVVQLASHIHRNHTIYHHVQSPAEEGGGAHVLGCFCFKRCPPGVCGADGDGLEDAQEAGGAHRHFPAHAVNIENKFASNIPEKMLQPESCHCFGNCFRQND